MEYTEEEIEKEIETRVRFKMNELLAGVSNVSKMNWQKAFHCMNPKYHHYSEAFAQLGTMFEKELFMAYPYKFNEKQETEWKEKRNKTIDKIVNRLNLRGTRDCVAIEKFLYHELEKLKTV
ncbi:hypothetical protein [Flavobacterium sp. FlaQc-50]|uniref:hypothetical protein n=1 Tax=unclassified Flavobacterium TaxID=196869 RepID=UPI003756A334